MHTGRAPRPFLRLLLTVAPLCVAVTAGAQDLAWPEGSERVAQRVDPVAGFRIATGPHNGSDVPSLDLSGTLSEEVWQIPGALGDPALLETFLRGQLTDQGFEISFTCADEACGGFDFRYALPIADGPAMHVDLGQFHYIAATRPLPEGTEHVALTISAGGRQGYVHLVRVTPTGALPAAVTPSTRAVDDVSPISDGDEDLIAQLTETGAAVLSDVSFETGASALTDLQRDSLVALAAFLAEDPARRVVLVGHTDTEGSLEANITLSRARATSVRTHLIQRLGASPEQIAAEGIGYLAPRATNRDPTGREANRRVEVVLITN